MCKMEVEKVHKYTVRAIEALHAHHGGGGNCRCADFNGMDGTSTIR